MPGFFFNLVNGAGSCIFTCYNSFGSIGRYDGDDDFFSDSVTCPLLGFHPLTDMRENWPDYLTISPDSSEGTVQSTWGAIAKLATFSFSEMVDPALNGAHVMRNYPAFEPDANTWVSQLPFLSSVFELSPL